MTAATASSTRSAFAALLDKLMRDGVNAVTASGAKAAVWSNAALAARYDHFRTGGSDVTTSPTMIANWRKQKFLPSNVEPLVDAIYGRPPKDPAAAEALRVAYREAKGESVIAGAARLRRGTGKPFALVDDDAVLGQGTRPTDLSRARAPEQQRLQTAVRDRALKLAKRLAAGADDDMHRDVADASAGLAEIAALKPEALVKRLGDMYVLITDLGGYVKSDTLTRAEPGRNLPPLPADASGALTALVQLALAWALDFPSLKKLDAQAAGFDSEATAEDARKLFEEAREATAIRAVDADTLTRLAEAAGPDTRPGKKAEALSTRYGADLAALGFEAIARAAAGDPEAQVFARKALDVLRAVPDQAARLGGPELTRQAIQIGVESINLLKEPRRENIPCVFVSYAHQDNRETPPGETLGWTDWAMSFLRPVEKRGALRLWIDSDMRGSDAWDSRIRAQLSDCDIFVLLLSRHALASDYIERVEVPAILRRIESGSAVRFYGVVLTPISEAARWPALERIRLRPQDGRPLSRLPPPERDHTMAEIADEIAALCRKPPIPTNVEEQARETILRGDAPPEHWRAHIRELDFSDTALSDAAPLAGLTALTTLDLRNTRVADAAPLAGLTALMTLVLSGTKITDAAPLAGLTALKTLNLGATEMADGAPLARLTALTSLDLGFTQIADVAPLAVLTALTSLYLGATQIADVAPLAGLTALKVLDLEATNIVDLAPLARLTVLEHLDLSETRVADLSPLASLRNLKKLFLYGIPTLDLAPLAGLIAGGLKIEGQRVPKWLARKPRASPRRPPPAPSGEGA